MLLRSATAAITKAVKLNIPPSLSAKPVPAGGSFSKSDRAANDGVAVFGLGTCNFPPAGEGNYPRVPEPGLHVSNTVALVCQRLG